MVLFALILSKTASYLFAHFMHPSYLLIREDLSGAKPGVGALQNQTFTPKNIKSSFRLRTVQLDAFFFSELL